MKVKNVILAAVVAVSSLFISAPVFAGQCEGGVSDASCNKICSDSKISDEQKKAAGCTLDKSAENQLPERVRNIINMAISTIGILAVLVIAFAAQRLITGGGDPVRVKQAKDMIIYAVVAIVVATLAWAIINYIVGAIGK